MPAKLIVIAGPDKGKAFDIADDQKLTVGRGEATVTKLRDPTVSRMHCQVVSEGGRYSVENLGAASGTAVNGRRISAPQSLRPGDLIRIGDTELRFVVEGLAAEPSAQAEAPEPLSELIGTTLAHFQIQRKIARGSSGMVFLATDTNERRPVALKVLWPEFSKNEEEMKRFVRAMKTMLPVRHENIVAVYGAGKNGPHCWIAMEYVDGESLADVIRRIGLSGMLDWTNAFRVAMHIGRALEAAFDHSIVHRNISPRNVLVRSSDRVAKLGDLMFAKALEGTMAEQITKPGQLVGELVYMSPERTHGSETVDCRSDIYSLGAMLYELLTGRPPFEAGTLPEVIKKIREEPPIRPKKYQLAIPDFFEDAVMKMLRKEPGERFQTPTELINQLERIAKFQHRAVWEASSNAAPGGGAPAAPLLGTPAEYAVHAPAPVAPRPRASSLGASPPLDAPPSTHLFRNILAGLLDEGESAPEGSSAKQPLSELIGQTLYVYQVKRVLARGKSGTVFYAEHTGKSQPTALKVLWPRLADKEDEVHRFVRAIKTMMPLRHPNIVQLHDAGRTDGYCWMAMEYVKGASLTKVIDQIGIGRGMLDWRDALAVGVQIGRALEAAFAEHIIHRSITPQNILIRASDNVAKLADLMLAKAFEGRRVEEITGHGELVGDLTYMSPERTQASGEIDQRSDIYSLGATVYTLLAGRPPFAGNTLPDLVGKIRRSKPPSPREFQNDIPELLERIVQKMLAKQPAERYQTPQELVVDLERVASAEGIEL